MADSSQRARDAPDRTCLDRSQTRLALCRLARHTLRARLDVGKILLQCFGVDSQSSRFFVGATGKLLKGLKPLRGCLGRSLPVADLLFESRDLLFESRDIGG